jgi:hypothetical protein
MDMKTTMIALALLLGLAAGGATLVSGQAHAADQSSFVKYDRGGGANG